MATLIDNILVDHRIATNASSGIFLDNTSDHLPCFTIIPNISPTRKQQLEITSRDTRHKNITALRSFLCSPGTLLPLQGTNVDEQFDHFHNTLHTALDHFLPERTRKIPARSLRKEPWMTAGLLRCIKKSKRLYKSMLLDRSNVQKMMKYKDYNNLLQRVKRTAKSDYYYNKCVEHKGNTSKLWKTINYVIHRTNNKSEVIEKLKINNLYEYRGQYIAEEFARYFSAIGREYATSMKTPNRNLSDYLNCINTSEKSIFLSPTTEVEIMRYINDLHPKRSSGLDNINNILLKELRDIIAKPLSMIFNNSISEGVFPSKMKTAKVIPLYKSKNRYETTNYRPISLLLTISKLLEKAMHRRVYNYLCDTGQLYASQYGFRKNHACDHAIGELVSVITKGMEQKKLTAGVFLDLSKAFDSLEHSAIFRKMEKYGLRGGCLDWFTSYLQDRKLSVSCKTMETGENFESELYDVEYGTPQGSVLGPLIFLILCNNLHIHLIFLSCIQFADDTTLYISHTSLDYIKFCLKHDLGILQDWFLANKLTLNIGKSVLILFGKHKSKLCIQIGKEIIPQSKFTKFLGLWIDENLN